MPLIVALGTFQIFFENSQRYLHINDICVKFATNTASVIDTGGKFAIDVMDTGGNLPMVLTTLVANLLQIMGTLSDC
jgi:hypothetical protein